MWYQLKVMQLPESSLDAASEQLEEGGALSVTYTDSGDTPIYEPELNTVPLWRDTVITALFDDKALADLALQALTLQYPNASGSIEELPDRAWERAWLDDFGPMQFGNRLWICPSHCQPPMPEAVNILLDPGLAFGTGTHPTTALCLSLLDEIDVADKTVCDYGTGSGILAIAAVKLGARHVQAVDIDPQAVMAARDNAERNLVNAQRLDVSLVGQKALAPVDIVLANILAGPLIELSSQLLALVKPRGTLVLSGILEEQLTTVLAAYQSQFDKVEVASKEGWQRIVLTKKIN